ncbi:MAG: heavy metal transporter [Bacteroidetes bacterium 4572_77]|nr:MAG: heavy metal transporter [Bacteroidetes bacterium 4572_77]
MMITTFYLDNVKCMGCKNTLIKEARKQKELQNIQVDIATGKVVVEYVGGREILGRIKSRLYRRGYPEKGRNDRITKAKSYISCAVGRISGPVKFEVPAM